MDQENQQRTGKNVDRIIAKEVLRELEDPIQYKSIKLKLFNNEFKALEGTVRIGDHIE